MLAKEYGIKKGDKVAIIMRNRPDWIVVGTAVPRVSSRWTAQLSFFVPLVFPTVPMGYPTPRCSRCRRQLLAVARRPGALHQALQHRRRDRR